MKKRRVMAALAAALAIGGGVWLVSREKKPGGGAASENRPVLNTTHEKVFLAEQLRRNPTHPPILLRLAQIERGEGNLRGAREHLEQAVVAEGKQVEIRLELGLVCGEMGDMAAAEEQNREVLRIEPGQPDALYNLGAIAANRGDVQSARAFWTEAVRRGRNSDAVEKSRQAIARLQAVAR